MKRFLIVFAAAVAAALVPVGKASAQTTATSNLAVSATVVDACTIDPAVLSFGNYFRTAPVTVSADITVHCTQGTILWIGLGLGNNPSGAVRRMVNGGAFLEYELYRENTHTDVWTDAVPAPAYHETAVLPGLNDFTQTVYGRIPAGQLVSSGAYSDTVLMTVHF